MDSFDDDDPFITPDTMTTLHHFSLHDLETLPEVFMDDGLAEDPYLNMSIDDLDDTSPSFMTSRVQSPQSDIDDAVALQNEMQRYQPASSSQSDSDVEDDPEVIEAKIIHDSLMVEFNKIKLDHLMFEKRFDQLLEAYNSAQNDVFSLRKRIEELHQQLDQNQTKEMQLHKTHTHVPLSPSNESIEMNGKLIQLLRTRSKWMKRQKKEGFERKQRKQLVNMRSSETQTGLTRKEGNHLIIRNDRERTCGQEHGHDDHTKL